MEKRSVYLDYSATTPLKKEVLDEMMPFLTEEYGNPSSVYEKGINSRNTVLKSRKKIANLINAQSDEIFFTSSGTEADNWAVFGAAGANFHNGEHIIVSNIEHNAVLESAKRLEKQGFEVTYLEVNKEGLIKPEDLSSALREDTILVSIMMANNEIGTVQPIKRLAEITHEKGALFHTDAVQALGNIPIDVKKLGIDLMSFSAHKIYGPKGIGALYIKEKTQIDNFIYGGSQEMKRRAGTENLPGIVGFGKAAELAGENLENHYATCLNLRNYLADEIFEGIFESQVNGSMLKRLPGNLNVSFDYIEGEAILLMLDSFGISVSTGSACNSSQGSASHVLRAIGVPDSKIHGTIRFTVGDFTTKDDIDYVVESLKTITKKLREISPLNRG